ncbi:MucB/RseB C-terminal domain-containing protein [Ramlibacter sp. PS4R-6]|uniref:MucB/RseB C-terminal domain-containing protein n=1 Tax=Ramlibacter sp. PS4R-6 TaxID=3133438 RepID=UPI003098E87C
MPTTLPTKRSFARGLVAVGLGFGFGFVNAQPAPPASAQLKDRTVSEWLVRMHEASKIRSYVGTFVVSSIGGGMSSARIWHAYEGEVQVERVEALTGAPRSVFRRNEQVVTFFPEAHVVRTEKRESLGLFTNLLKSTESAIPEYYVARRVGGDRVAGFEADVVQLAPRDNLRFGYRIWSERRSGLVVKLQTVDGDGNVLEQSAFSELALDTPVRADKLTQMMAATQGWRIESLDVSKTTAEGEGWQLPAPPPGFKPISCYKRPVAGQPAPQGAMQWVFSDGLAAVSLFIEPYDARRHVQEGLFASGATQTLTRRVQDWWLTAVGEVPPATLRAFAQGLERRR